MENSKSNEIVAATTRSQQRCKAKQCYIQDMKTITSPNYKIRSKFLGLIVLDAQNLTKKLIYTNQSCNEYLISFLLIRPL